MLEEKLILKSKKAEGDEKSSTTKYDPNGEVFFVVKVKCRLLQLSYNTELEVVTKI